MQIHTQAQCRKYLKSVSHLNSLIEYSMIYTRFKLYSPLENILKRKKMRLPFSHFSTSFLISPLICHQRQICIHHWFSGVLWKGNIWMQMNKSIQFFSGCCFFFFSFRVNSNSIKSLQNHRDGVCLAGRNREISWSH